MIDESKIQNIGGFYNPRNKMFLLNIPKNASTSLRLTLGATEHSNLVKIDDWKGYRTVIVLRDPVDRIVSQYAEVLLRRMEGSVSKRFFSMPEGKEKVMEFLNEVERGIFDPHVAPQAHHACDSEGNLFPADYVFLLETLPKDFKSMNKECELYLNLAHTKQIDPRAKSAHAWMREDEDIINRLKEIYPRDFEIYNQIKNEREQ